MEKRGATVEWVESFAFTRSREFQEWMVVTVAQKYEKKSYDMQQVYC